MPLLGRAMTTCRHRYIFGPDRGGHEIRGRVSCPRSLELLPRSPRSLRSILTIKMCVSYGVIGIIAGIYVCSSSAFAETEEDASQELGKSGYSVQVLSQETLTSLIINSSVNDDANKYISSLGSNHDENPVSRNSADTYSTGRPGLISSKQYSGFDSVFIPETVWSLDVSTGAHLGSVSGTNSEFYAAFGERPEITDSLDSAIFGARSGNDKDNVSDLLSVPLQLQVASCGGTSAEHSNLDYCNNSVTSTDQSDNKNPRKSNNKDDDSGTESVIIDGIVSNGASSPSSNPQPAIAPTIAATVNKLTLQGNLSLIDPCGDVTAPCATVEIDPPATPIESLGTALSIPPIDGLTPPTGQSYPEVPTPGPIIYIDDPPLSDLPPVFLPEPRKPIPEASTLVMTITGFSIMGFFFGKKRRPRINPISIIDVSEAYCERRVL
jgi:hypothetical protein